MEKNLYYVFDVTIPFYGALKSLSEENKFKSLHKQKITFSALIGYFYTKITSLSCLSTKNHDFDLFSYSKITLFAFFQSF